MNDYLRAWLWSLIGSVKQSYDHVQIDEAQWAPLEDALERTLIGWMGPGGDDAFLTLFALANAPDDLPVINYSGQGLTREDLVEEVQVVLRLAARSVYRARHAGQLHPLDRRGGVSLDGDWSAYVRSYAFGDADALLAIRRTYIGELFFTGIPKFGAERKSLSVAIAIQPFMEFRTAMMGELAAEWDVPDAIFCEVFAKP